LRRQPYEIADVLVLYYLHSPQSQQITEGLENNAKKTNTSSTYKKETYIHPSHFTTRENQAALSSIQAPSSIRQADIRLSYGMPKINLLLLIRSRIWLVTPDSSAHITRTSSKAATTGAGSNRNDGVLVALQHELGVAGSWVPELDTTIL
jgi:hypothetical protein